MSFIVIKTSFSVTIAGLMVLLAVLWYKEWNLKKKGDEYIAQVEMRTVQMEQKTFYREEINALIEMIRCELGNKDTWEDLADRCDCFTVEPLTEIAVVDALVGYKKHVCQKMNIECIVELGAMTMYGFTDTEYVGLFGNLLDNAIEAAVKTEKPWVHLTSAVTGGQWILKVSNSKPESEKPLECAMETTKGNGHGLGTKIVSKIVKRHKGVIEYKDSGKSFEVMVVFSVEEST